MENYYSGVSIENIILLSITETITKINNSILQNIVFTKHEMEILAKSEIQSKSRYYKAGFL